MSQPWKRRYRHFLIRSVVLCGLVLSQAAPARSHEGHELPSHALGAIFPRLSGSGDQIAFSYQGAIWRTPRTGGAMIRLTADAGFDVEPAWSPDGTRIAYINTRNFFGGALRLIRAEDGSPVPLPREITVRDKLHFDPSGKRLLGNIQSAGQNFVLAWFDLETGELEPIQPSASRQRNALSSDGEWIATTTSLDAAEEQGGNNGPEADVWKIPARGGEPQKIVRFPARIYDLCWASDDRSLLIVSDLGGAHNDVWQLPLDDPQRGARKLTFGQADEDCPSVSHDGRWLLWTDNRHGATSLVLNDLMLGKSAPLEISRRDFQAPTGSLNLNVVDKARGGAAPARISVQHAGGKYHAPPGSLYRLLNSEMHFYAGGRAELDLPVGRYRVNIARGPEYRIARSELEIRPDQTTTATVALDRWTDQPALGWYSGESHIHANYGYGHWYNSPRTILAQCAGEDLLVCNLMVANSDGDGVFDREYFRGRPDPLSTDRTVLYWNEEFRSTIWGHMTLLNLKQLVEPIFTGFDHTTHPHDHPTNADIADHTHDQDGHVNYTHPASNTKDPYLSAYSAKELPIDVALGKVDSIDVMGSNHLANMPLWYRLLNCGFHIPASAGTDCFLNRIPSRLPGSDRAYVKVEGPFTYQRWTENLKAGRTFVTNGPMFEFSLGSSGMQAALETNLGETMRCDGPTEVHALGRVRSQHPLDRVEIIYNGEVAATAEVTGDGRAVAVDETLTLNTSGWVALRASGPPHPDQPGGSVFGHTSPIYVEVPGAPLDSRAEAEYFLTWIDRLWAAVRQRNRIPPRHQTHVESQISAARAVYAKLVGRGP